MILVWYKNGRSEYFENVNLGKRWADNSTNNAELRLKNKVEHSEIKCLKISTKFGGGMFGDNWNLNNLGITAFMKDGTTHYLKSVSGTPWMRFTEDHRDKTVFVNWKTSDELNLRNPATIIKWLKSKRIN